VLSKIISCFLGSSEKTPKSLITIKPYITAYYRNVVHQESMKLMGMKGWLHWTSWFFKFSVFMLISVLIMAIFFHVKLGDGRAVITYGDPTVTFVFLLLFAISVMTFCFAISTFFSKGLFSDIKNSIQPNGSKRNK